MRNEWRSNLWLAIEFLIVSVVLWYCVDRLADFIRIYNEPRGHDISHVYKITPGRISDMESDRPDYECAAELLERIRRRPEVESAAMSRSSTPYCGSSNGIWIWNNDTVSPVYSCSNNIHRWIQPDFFKVYRISGLRGETPEQLAEILRPGLNVFGACQGLFVDSCGSALNAVDYIGQKFEMSGYPDHTLAAVTPVMKRFDSDRLVEAEKGCWDMMVDHALHCANEISVRVKPDMDTPSFIDDLMDDSESQLRVGPYFIMKVERMTDLRHSVQMKWTIDNRNYIVGIIFLMVNIFLGLLGTFWFRIQMRTPDIAILKVVGATRGDIFRRLICEGLIILIIVTPFALLCDWLLFDNGFLNLPAYAGSFYAYDYIRQLLIMPLITFLLLALMLIAGIYFPARRAMNLAPATALRSE